MRFLFAPVLIALGLSPAHAQTSSEDGFVEFTSGSQHMCGLRADGSVECTTSSVYTRYDIPENFPAMATIAAGGTHSCGVDLNGGVRCWGDNDLGQLNAPTDVNNFVSVSVGFGFHNCGVTDENQVICWGLNTNGQASPPNDGFGYTEVYVNYQSSCGLRTDGDIECWGGTDPDAPSRFFDGGPYLKYITEGFRANCAILEGGEFYCGDGSSDIMTDLYTDIVFSYPDICGLTQSGEIDCVREPGISSIFDSMGDTPGTFTQIQRAFSGICGLDTGGVIQCWNTPETGSFVPPGVERSIPMPVGVSVTAYSDSTVEISWERLEGAGYGVISGYEVFRDDEFLAFSEGTSTIDDSLSPGISYRYSVRALSFDGVQSEFSDEIIIDTGDRGGSAPTGGSYTPPQRPGEPTQVELFFYSDSLLELVWNRPDSSQVKGYEIRRNGEYVGFTQGVSYVDDDVSEGNCYRYDILPVHDDGHILGLLTATSGGEEGSC